MTMNTDNTQGLQQYILVDKETGVKSKPFDINWLITGDGDLEFENDESLPLKDYLFFKDDYTIEPVAPAQPSVIWERREDGSEKKTKLYAVSVSQHEPSRIVFDDSKVIAEFLDDWMKKNTEVGDKISIEIVELTEKQLSSLPDVND